MAAPFIIPEDVATPELPHALLAGGNKFGFIDCPTCHSEPELMGNRHIWRFRNAISVKEYHISGMCQECQDDVFGKD